MISACIHLLHISMIWFSVMTDLNDWIVQFLSLINIQNYSKCFRLYVYVKWTTMQLSKCLWLDRSLRSMFVLSSSITEPFSFLRVKKRNISDNIRSRPEEIQCVWQLTRCIDSIITASKGRCRHSDTRTSVEWRETTVSEQRTGCSVGTRRVGRARTVFA